MCFKANKTKLFFVLMMLVHLLSACGEEGGSSVSPNSAGSDDSGIKRVFISSTTYTGNLGGLAGADAKCNSLAAAAGLGGTWTAYVSTTTTDAFDRITEVGPWYLVNESTLVFANKDQFETGPSVTLSMDENGDTVSGTSFVWTGSGGQGEYHTTYGACADWTTASAGTTGVYGHRLLTTVFWQTSGYSNCSVPRYIYCFEQ